MKDTMFYLSEKQVRSYVTPARNDREKLADAPLGYLLGKAPTARDRFAAPNGGLFSTTPDYARFALWTARVRQAPSQP